MAITTTPMLMMTVKMMMKIILFFLDADANKDVADDDDHHHNDVGYDYDNDADDDCNDYDNEMIVIILRTLITKEKLMRIKIMMSNSLYFVITFRCITFLGASRSFKFLNICFTLTSLATTKPKA